MPQQEVSKHQRNLRTDFVVVLVTASSWSVLLLSTSIDFHILL